MIWFDRTQKSVVAGCTPCGRREVFTSQRAADAWALDHVYRAHPEPSHEHMKTITASRVRKHRDTP
jgi:hypothetical protein